MTVTLTEATTFAQNPIYLSDTLSQSVLWAEKQDQIPETIHNEELTPEAVAYHYLHESDLESLPETEVAINSGEVYIARGTLTITPTSQKFDDDFLQSTLISNDMTFKAVGSNPNFSHTVKELIRTGGSYRHSPVLALVEVQAKDGEVYGSHFHALVEDVARTTEE